MRSRVRSPLVVLLAGLLSVSLASPAGATPSGLTDVLFVANNWDGTADYMSPDGELTQYGRVDVVPDKDERIAEIYRDPVRTA